MGDKGTFWMPEQASTLASEIDGLFYFVFWISLILFVAVIGAMVYFVFRYRRRGDGEHIPAPLAERKVVEIAWIAGPLILCLLVFTWGFKAFLKQSIAPADAYQIQVRASSWAWNFTYPNGTSVGSELRVPVDRPVKLTMSSDDVLHSFFVPSFRVKFDVLPNRYTSVWFEATEVGEFDIFCTEYCGTGHSAMLAKVIVQSEEDFKAWVATSGMGDMTPVEYGAVLFSQQNCAVCHSIDGTRGVGPTLKGLLGRPEQFTDGTSLIADDNYILESIINPAAKIVDTYPPAMPATYSTLQPQQLDALVAYIKSLE